MTDAELETLAKKINRNIVGQSMAWQKNEHDILAALRFVRDASAPKPLPEAEVRAIAESNARQWVSKSAGAARREDLIYGYRAGFQYATNHPISAKPLPVSGEIPTPRVDEEFRHKPLNDFNGQPVVLAEFARQLERNLQAQSMADELASALTVLLDLPASGDNAVIAARNGARSKAREVLARFEAAAERR